MTNPAIEAVQRYLLSQPLEQLTTDGARRVAVDLAAIFLDNMPREPMVFAVQGYRPQGVISLYFAEQLVAAAISAARATLLPGDA